MGKLVLLVFSIVLFSSHTFTHKHGNDKWRHARKDNTNVLKDSSELMITLRTIGNTFVLKFYNNTDSTIYGGIYKRYFLSYLYIKIINSKSGKIDMHSPLICGGWKIKLFPFPQTKTIKIRPKKCKRYKVKKMPNHIGISSKIENDSLYTVSIQTEGGFFMNERNPVHLQNKNFESNKITIRGDKLKAILNHIFNAYEYME